MLVVSGDEFFLFPDSIYASIIFRVYISNRVSPISSKYFIFGSPSLKCFFYFTNRAFVSLHLYKCLFISVSDPGMRFLVYLVSLALSLAALGILKLHKLLEWLIVVSCFGHILRHFVYYF